ncbi:MAG: hypothetical protein WC659_01670 [Patescibacteria group bacterium]
MNPYAHIIIILAIILAGLVAISWPTLFYKEKKDASGDQRS